MSHSDVYPPLQAVVKVILIYLNTSRDEGKLSRKLIECVNTFLLKDGPNLGSLSLEIHNAVEKFVFRCWLTTHDKNLKVNVFALLLFVIFLC